MSMVSRQYSQRIFVLAYSRRMTVSVNPALDNTFYCSRKEGYLCTRKRRREQFFTIFNILLVNRRKCELCQLFLVNIRGKYSFSPILDE